VIVLETDVLSALMGRHLDAVVVEWLNEQPSESVWTTAVTVFEVRFGLKILVDGRRRRQLEVAFGRMLADDLEGRVLAFDPNAAREAAWLAARRRQAGRPIGSRDAQIAGIVAARRATLATRDTRQFADLGITLVDPWAGRWCSGA
jgi:predicted nucleic acid-binding protein